jgi:hypothetical protein
MSEPGAVEDEGVELGTAATLEVIKTPPGESEVADVVSGLAAEVSGADGGADETPEATGTTLEPPPPPFPSTAAQVPVIVTPLLPAPVTSVAGPGSGKTRSVPSIEVHPFPMFATKMDGRDENATSGLVAPAPPAIVTAEQSW